jgi:DUF917 family protein
VHPQCLVLVDAKGFITGTVEMRGILNVGNKQRQEGNLRIGFKNEYLALWFDETPLASSPDSLCVVDTTTGGGVPISHKELRPKRHLTIVGLPAAQPWRTKKSIELFGPSHFQLSMEYKPIEKLV